MFNIKKGKWIALTISLVLLLSLGVGIALSYIITGTSPIENIFDPARVSCTVESSDGQTKSDVGVKNTGNTPIYVRVAIIVNFQSDTDSAELHARAPKEGVDYTISLSNDPLWVKGADGYWYYCQPLAPDTATPTLIREITPIGEAPAGYSLSAEILTSAIQATPANAVAQAWGVTVTGDTIVP